MAGARSWVTLVLAPSGKTLTSGQEKRSLEDEDLGKGRGLSPRGRLGFGFSLSFYCDRIEGEGVGLCRRGGIRRSHVLSEGRGQVVTQSTMGM